MITLLASICGFIGSLFPEVVKYFFDKNHHKQYLEVMEMQAKFAEQGLSVKLKEIEARAEISETNALYNTYNVGINWVDAFNGTVRPALAYSFFLIYSVIKYLQFVVVTHSQVSTEMLELMWSGEDQAIFAGIISFYFGQRALSKIRKK